MKRQMNLMVPGTEGRGDAETRGDGKGGGGPEAGGTRPEEPEYQGITDEAAMELRRGQGKQAGQGV